MGQIVSDQLAASDTMLLGRRTYEEFAAFWPGQGDDVPLAAEINGVRKLVASTTLQDVDWQNSELIQGSVPEDLRRRKAEDGKDISITGSPTLVRSLLDAGVLDELRLLVHPIVVGHGKRLFADGAQVPLRLASSRTLETGVQYMVYAPAEA
jgi:dihydrofolate reductase